MLTRLINSLRNPKQIPGREQRAQPSVDPQDELCTGITFREARFILQSLHRLDWRDQRVADAVLLERKLKGAMEGHW